MDRLNTKNCMIIPALIMAPAQAFVLPYNQFARSAMRPQAGSLASVDNGFSVSSAAHRWRGADIDWRAPTLRMPTMNSATFLAALGSNEEPDRPELDSELDSELHTELNSELSDDADEKQPPSYDDDLNVDIEFLMNNQPNSTQIIRKLTDALKEIDRPERKQALIDLSDILIELQEIRNANNMTAINNTDPQRCDQCLDSVNRTHVNQTHVNRTESQQAFGPKQDIRADLLERLINGWSASGQKPVKFENPLPLASIGVPLILFAEFFTWLRYGDNILTGEDALLQFCLGYCTYGVDRLLDALDASDDDIDPHKQELYSAIKRNQDNVMTAIAASGFFILSELAQSSITWPFIPLLASTMGYRELKEKLGPAKAFYLGGMWAVATVILPSVMHDHDYSVLNAPMDYLPAALLLFGATNFADCRDVEEDKINKINTLPVLLGKDLTQVIASVALILSVGMVVDRLLSAHP